MTDETGTHWKFYSEHLTTCPNFEGLVSAIADVLRIRFSYDLVGRLIFSAPEKGYQRWVKNGEYRGG